ncbi:hypothetical protein cyc_01652 [Cyclospora cayetanensis]|uniref:Uncharacterized protein n=1 Tax=Cyclospora cayetanensis TaxID=88456 RepID=A0A1D3D5K3_9EIME|nr:hypothetical protein cyc_01652 [Cyclospora cayetanensis]
MATPRAPARAEQSATTAAAALSHQAAQLSSFCSTLAPVEVPAVGAAESTHQLEKNGLFGVVTWNVAGWRSAVSGIKKDWGSIEAFLRRLDCEILCLQEAKTGEEQVRADPMPVGATLDGWETFWCCCSSCSRRGLMGYSGVATIVRQGLTLRADCQPFSKFLPTRQSAEPALDRLASEEGASSSACGASTSAQAAAAMLGIPASLGGPGFSCKAISRGALAASTRRGAVGRGPHTAMDMEGRALVTEHSGLVVINTYCPASGFCWDRLAFKMHFLHGLRAVMLHQRLLRRKPVVLMGDLNATTSCKDVSLLDATVNIRGLWPPPSPEEGAGDWQPCEALSPSLQRKLLAGGPLVERLLRDPQYHEVRHSPGGIAKKEQHHQQARQPQVNVGRRRQGAFRFFLKPPGARPRQIGRPFDSEDEARMRLSLDAWRVPVTPESRIGASTPAQPVPARAATPVVAGGSTAAEASLCSRGNDRPDEASTFRFVVEAPLAGGQKTEAVDLECTYTYTPDGEGGTSWICKEANRLSLLHLADCFTAVQVPLTDDEVYQLYIHLGLPSHSSCVANFMQSLMREDGMIDAFAAAANGSSKGPSGATPLWVGAFTAWDQYTNKRYTNEGARIDFVLLDAELVASLQPLQAPPEPPPLQGLPPCRYNSLQIARAATHQGGLTLNSERLLTYQEFQKAAKAAVQRATAGGLWVGAPRDGGGLQAAVPLRLRTAGPDELQALLYKSMLIDVEHSGLVYLSPLYSDHIAVRCVLRHARQPRRMKGLCHSQDSSTDRESSATSAGAPASAVAAQESLLGPCVLKDDPCTKKAQPQRKWRGLGSFLKPWRSLKSAVVEDPADKVLNENPCCNNGPLGALVQQRQHGRKTMHDRSHKDLGGLQQQTRELDTAEAAKKAPTHVVVLDDCPSDAVEVVVATVAVRPPEQRFCDLTGAQRVREEGRIASQQPQHIVQSSLQVPKCVSP